MAYNNEKFRIIEFNGTPGCGKTTVVRSLAERLTCKTKYNYYRNRIDRNAYSLLLNPNYYPLLKQVFKYANLYSHKKELLRCLLPAVFIRKYHNFLLDDSTSLLLFDQGFVQSIISLAHTDNLIVSPLLESIFDTSGLNNLPIFIVNCNCDIDVSMARIKGRPDNGARVHDMTDEKLYNTLNIQMDNFFCLRDVMKEKCPNVKTMDMDTNFDVSENVDSLIKQMAVD